MNDISNIIGVDIVNINEADNGAEQALEFEITSFLNFIYNYLIACHKHNDKLIDLSELIADKEIKLKKMKGANYNHLRNQINEIAENTERKNYQTEIKIINDTSSIVADIAHTAHYLCWAYGESFLSPIAEDVFNNYSAQSNKKIFSKYKIDDQFKLAVEAMLCLLIAQIYKKEGHYRLALNRYADAQRIMRLPNINSLFAEIQTNRASLGGLAKRRNYQSKKDKAINFLNSESKYKNLKPNGSFEISNAKAAREIIKYFDDLHQSLGYAENSLANIIGEYRKSNFSK